MPTQFSSGYEKQPFRGLCEAFPDASTYQAADFRSEWGPIFHRGRLDGTARVLVIGQDPAAHEAIARRILVGAAGHRVQGFLAKLGITRRYVMINAFLYSVYGKGGARHKSDAAIVAYRNRWLDAILAGGKIEAVVALGGLADDAWIRWKATPAAMNVNPAYAHVTHPTAPESAGGAAAVVAASTQKLLANWNKALTVLKPSVSHPDVQTPLNLYGTAFAAADLSDIPAQDLPPGLPEWMRRADAWATRTGGTATLKRATITTTVPQAYRN